MSQEVMRFFAISASESKQQQTVTERYQNTLPDAE